eukprot:TRINITY_DN6590_c0_g1_i1.p1 TRINITY_DN6590_c0_g1~~TRINITY_DN6590_c0_g1_i1.p1  ORF type:complete len:641 (-),score=107.96 TRINITY_DN6590_c0_g1_i1:437-2305(-)
MRVIQLVLVGLLVTSVAAQTTPTKVVDPPILHCDDTRNLLQIGSSTVFPLAQAHSVNYANPMVAPLVVSTGSSLGFENFLSQGSDIATSSRKLRGKDYEAVDCLADDVDADGNALRECQGRLPVGVRVAVDLISIIVHPQASWVPESITLEDLSAIFDMDNTQLWSDIFEGGPRDPPFLKIPDAKSGTRDFFEDITGLTFTGVPGFPDDLALIEEVAAAPDAIGFVGVGQALRGGDTIRIVSVDGVSPTEFSTVDDYPLSRSLYKYLDMAPGADNFQAADFICSLLTEEGQALVEQAGYAPLPLAELTTDRELLLCEDRPSLPKSTLSGIMAEAFQDCRSNRVPLIGSSTLYPISVEAQRLFQSRALVVIPRSTGSSIGIADLISGAVPIAASSRYIKASDYESFNCPGSSVESLPDGSRVARRECLGVLPVPVQVGQDMLAIIVNKNNSAINDTTSFSPEDLKALFLDKAPWSEVVTSAPAVAPNLYMPDIASGTRGFFHDALGVVLPDQGYVNDEDILKGVESDPLGLGFVGLAYADPARVRAVPVDGVSPYEKDKSNEYYLMRPLFYYIDSSPDGFSADVDLFICFVLSDNGQEIVDSVGYVKLSPEMQETLRTTFQCV